jgi:hypothetical protein
MQAAQTLAAPAAAAAASCSAAINSMLLLTILQRKTFQSLLAMGTRPTAETTG